MEELESTKQLSLLVHQITLRTLETIFLSDYWSKGTKINSSTQLFNISL